MYNHVKIKKKKKHMGDGSHNSIVLNNCSSRPETNWNFTEGIETYKC